MKRILLFLATNLAVVVLLGIALRLIGFEGILDSQGVDLNPGALLVFAALFGFAGSFISLAMSKWTAKRMMGVRVITQPSNGRHIFERDVLYVKVPEKDAQTLLSCHMEDLTAEEQNVLREYVNMMRKKTPFWAGSL